MPRSSLAEAISAYEQNIAGSEEELSRELRLVSVEARCARLPGLAFLAATASLTDNSSLHGHSIEIVSLLDRILQACRANVEEIMAAA